MSTILAKLKRDLFNLGLKDSTEMNEVKKLTGTPGPIRTADLLVRSQLLYPAELRVHAGGRKSRRPAGWNAQ